MTLILEIAALFVLVPIAFILRARNQQCAGTAGVRVGEAAFFALSPQVRLMLDEYSIPTTVRNGVVLVDLAPEAWNLLLEFTERQRAHSTVELRRA
jgi:hypothetical protein